MDMREEADRIFNSDQSPQQKLASLKNLELDCVNQMEAQDQNMNPEQKHRLSEGLRKARDYIRNLS
jgi:hypothetical protein